MMTDGYADREGDRPRVTVVMPFFGDREEGVAALKSLASVRAMPGDELILVDNTPAGVLRRTDHDDRVRIVAAIAESSSYHARNVGAEEARNDWLLFVDADCEPDPALLDDYLAEPVGAAVGALVGQIAPADQDGLLTRWARSRRILSQDASLEAPIGPAGATANLLVRKAAWRSVGGFLEGVRSGADFDLCWRLGEAGWAVERRPGAVVRHRHRETLRGVVRQMLRYAAGNAWQNRRRPRSVPAPPGAAALLRSAGGFVGFGVTGQFERALLKVVDGVAATAQSAGRLLGNAAPRRAADREAVGGTVTSIVIATDRFPVLSESFVVSEATALRSRGCAVRIEAVARPTHPYNPAMRDLRVNFLEDEGVLERLAAMCWLVSRHPLRCLADLLTRRRWANDERFPLSAIAPMARRLARGGERHVHVHFAALASVNALRAGAIVGVPVSVAPHGHEVFVTPRALPEKLQRAAFLAAPCEYLARYLREIAVSGDRVPVQTIVMGIDGDRFRRTSAYPGGRTVVAVGRLVEKKGFRILVEAAAALESRAPLDRVVIAGEGPEQSSLSELAAERGVSERIEFPGALSPAEVRALLEEADVFAMPSVVASNGDRDAMPVVAKEALAMEVPVVASDEVGLPELVTDEWGRLVRPGDPEALAAALDEILALPPGERAEMGRAGRRFVVERFSVGGEAAKLASLIDGVTKP